MTIQQLDVECGHESQINKRRPADVRNYECI